MSNRDLINRLATIIGQYYACWCPSCFTRDEQSSLVNIMAAYTPATSEHYGDVIMGTIASQITSIAIVYSPVYSGADQRKHQSSASLAFVRGIHRGPVNSPHKWPVTRKIFPFDDVIMSRDVSKHNIGSTTWWRHQRETFSALLALCMGNSLVTGEFPSQRPVTRRFDVSCDLCLNRRSSKQSIHRWFGTPSHPLWRHCNETPKSLHAPFGQ